MAAEDWIDDLWESYWLEYEQGFRVSVTCCYCQTPELEWNHTPKGWRLFHSNGAEHTCPAFDQRAEGFYNTKAASQVVLRRMKNGHQE